MPKFLTKIPILKHFILNHYRLEEILKESVHIGTINQAALQLKIEEFIQTHLYQNEKYAHPKKLNRYEFQAFSQNGEDGIIEDIFRRVGVKDRYFVEFGAQNGASNNTTYLLYKGWQGAWIEGDPNNIETLNKKFKTLMSVNKIRVKGSFITAQNINQIFGELNVPKEFDLLSIDIDGNDYWIWKALEGYSPRVVVIEYNATFPSSDRWVMKYNPEHVWNESNYCGASLKSLELLGTKKGYKLVGCNFTGSNAFFIRDDLVGDKFHEPFTSENHYEPPRFYLIRRSGHRPDFGDFENI